MEKQCRDVIEFMKLRIHIVNTLNIKDIMKFVTDQQLKNYKLKFIPDCLRQWNIDLYILVERSVGMDC